MAIQTQPDLNSIVDEGLKKAGYSDIQVSNDKNLRIRAKKQWIEETKHDIWKLSKKLRSLFTTSTAISVENQSRYPFPSDYESDLTVTLLHGNERGTAQGSTSGTITLASDEGVSGSSILSKQIFITSGTAVGNMSQCTAYNSTTKVATVNPNWVTSPDSTSAYMIIDQTYPLNQAPIQDLDSGYHYTNPFGSSPTDERGTPSHYFPIGDSDTGEFILHRPPHHTSGVPYGMQLRYYADLLRVDLDSILMTTLYRRWRNELTQGVLIRALQDNDDKNYQTEVQVYAQMLRVFQGRETHGMDLTNLQQKVTT